MDNTDKTLSKSKATTPYEELEIIFFNEIIKLTPKQWLEICLRFEEDENNIEDSFHEIARTVKGYSHFLFRNEDEEKRRSQFVRWRHEHLVEYFLTLPEMIDHNNQPYFLRSTAFAVTNYAQRAFIITDERLPIKDKLSAAMPGLRPFYGFITLPSLDFNPPPPKSNHKKRQRNDIKLTELSGISNYIFHISFPDHYFTYMEKPPERIKIPPRHFYRKRTTHATWNFDRFIDLECLFGGLSKEKCAFCEHQLSHLITLPAIKGGPYTNLKELTLSTCMKCVGWIGEPIFFRHNDSGIPLPIVHKGGLDSFNGSVDVIRPAKIFLSKTSPKWFRQKWENSDHQNLNRIGGFPSWIQGKYNFTCPDCSSSMTFLLQLDSDLPTVDGKRWLWGSGGVLYIFWCDQCKIDGQIWQCT